jgi:hypothetical protein
MAELPITGTGLWVELESVMKRLFFTTILLTVSSSVSATDLTILVGYQFNTNFEISTSEQLPTVLLPGIGNPGDSVTLDEGPSFSLAVDFELEKNPDKRIGFYISRQQTDFENNAGLLDLNMDITHIHFTGMSYYPKGKMENFVLLGLGAGFYSPGDKTLDDETRLSGQIGVGTNYKISESLLLRMDARWILTFFNGSGAAFCSGGCAIKLTSDVYSQVQLNIGLQFRF